MKYQDGDYICLTWEDDDPEFFALKGHLPLEEARQIFDGTSNRLCEMEDFRWYLPSSPIHAYARWSREGSPLNGPSLRVYNESARGRFPVTMVNVLRRRTDEEMEELLDQMEGDLDKQING